MINKIIRFSYFCFLNRLTWRVEENHLLKYMTPVRMRNYLDTSLTSSTIRLDELPEVSLVVYLWDRTSLKY